jgi:hypothetical protein
VLATGIVLAVAALAAGLTSTWSPCGFSMLDTIGRASSRTAGRLAATLTFAVGAVAGGVATFASLASLGHVAHGVGGQVSVLAAAGIAVAAAAGEARGVRVVPQIRRQVPEPWRRTMPLPLATALYGVLLGLGFTTFVLTLGVWALAAIAFALGDVRIGIAVGLAFGAGRALPVLALAPAIERPFGLRALELMAERPSALRAFRLVDAAALACCAAVLAGAEARAANPVASAARDPSVAGGMLAWDAEGGGMLGAEDPDAAPVALPGTDPALGGALLAYRAGETISVVRASDRAPLVDVAAPGADALAVSDRWLVYRARGTDGGDRLVARSLADGSERAVASARPPAQIGRPALAGVILVYHVAGPTGSRLVELDLASGRRRVLRRSRFAQLANPSVNGAALLYVRQTNLAQLLQIGPRRPGGRDRVLLRLGGTAVRDDGHEPGHSTRTRTPPARPPAKRLLWTTALSDVFAYVTLVPVAGGPRSTIVRVPRVSVPWEPVAG